MLENLPHMLGIEPYMIKSNADDHEKAFGTPRPYK